MKLKTIEYMADAMGIEICGDLKRAPEYDSPDGECYTDEAGKRFLIDDLNLMTVIDPNEKPQEKTVPAKPRTVEKVRPFPVPAYAINRMETDRFGIPYKRANRIDETFRSERTPKWMLNWTYHGLKTDEEHALCAVACKGSGRIEYAKRSVDGLHAMDQLFTVAVAAAEEETKQYVLDRFQNDRAFLYAVRTYRLNDWNYQRIREQASKLLKENELKEIALLDENALVKKLLNSEITEAFEEALQKISSGENLLKLLEAGFNKPDTEKILARAARTEQDNTFEREVLNLILSQSLSGKESSALYLLHAPDLLFEALEKGRSNEVREKAENRIYDLYDRAASSGKPLSPLTDTQQDILSRFYESRHSMQYCFARKLLSPEKLLSLFEKRLAKGLETDEMLYNMENLTFPADLLVKMYRAYGRKTQDLAKREIRKLPPEQLKRIILEQDDPELLGFAYSALVERGEPAGDVLARLDSIVLPMIENAKTPDGYNHNGILSVYLKLGRELAAHYGFYLETQEGETQDGDTWIRDTLHFDGHSFLLSDS